jgi:negative regulator of flagellin synthesis FlgM
MKIDPSLLKSVASGPPVEEQTRNAKDRVPAAPSAPESSSVHLSSTAVQLKELQMSFSDTPVINSARVEEIKQAISDGSFKIDASKIADGLIKTAQDLIRANRS